MFQMDQWLFVDFVPSMDADGVIEKKVLTFLTREAVTLLCIIHNSAQSRLHAIGQRYVHYQM